MGLFFYLFSNKLLHHAGNFPVIFMLMLVVVVAGYFAYHNRTKVG